MPLFLWILNTLYVAVVLAVSPVLAWRRIRYGKYRSGWGEKLLGRLPRSGDDERVIWFHAVSVGEVLQLETVVPRVAARYPSATILISTTTGTGRAVARDKFPQHRVCYFPLDFSWAVRAALQRVRPALIVLVELELWPGFILEADRERIPLMLINGRLSERSWRGYRRVRWLMRPVLRCFHGLGVQTEAYRERLVDLGAVADRVAVTGSVKFDRARIDRDHPAALELRRAFGVDRDAPVLVAGSTQSPEEQAALETYHRLKEEFPPLRLILVPRHKERFDEVARLVETAGSPLLRRTATGPAASADPHAVLLLDTLGELADCWALADIAFVGGSFGDRGGQNMIEPAAYGAAVLFGPRTENFADVVADLLAVDGALVVPSPESLEGCVGDLLRDTDRARQLGARAQQVVRAQTGASDRTLNMLAEVLDRRLEPANGLARAA